MSGQWSTRYKEKPSGTPRSSYNVKYSSDLTPYRTLWFSAGVCDISNELCFLMEFKFNVFRVRKCIWHPFSCDMGLNGTLTETHLRLVRYGVSECHLNPYRTQMDAICTSYCLVICHGDDTDSGQAQHQHKQHINVIKINNGWTPNTIIQREFKCGKFGTRIHIQYQKILVKIVNLLLWSYIPIKT